MKLQIETSFNSFVIICCCFLLFSHLPEVADSITLTPKNASCPFHHLYQFGDGANDIGNLIRIQPTLPAARLPYGITYPGGKPTGRWSDGLVTFDYTGMALGRRNNVPYLSINGSTSNSSDGGVAFATAYSTVHNRSFFDSRDIPIPDYAIHLRDEIDWFKTYLRSVCSTPQDCASRLGDSLVLMGDVEANDIGYALVQGNKSIKEVTTYVPSLIQTVINATRELIAMGATRVIIPNSAPLGCFPYILTALPNDDPEAYDALGCLKSVNDVIVSKNLALLLEIEKLCVELPTVTVLYADVYTSIISVMGEASVSGNLTLKSCCGVGGKYNYDRTRFCGSPGVPVCDNPNQYIFWDGQHYTQQTSNRFLQKLVIPTLVALGCSFNIL